MPWGATALLGMGELKVTESGKGCGKDAKGATALLGIGELKDDIYGIGIVKSWGATALLGMGELKVVLADKVSASLVRRNSPFRHG